MTTVWDAYYFTFYVRHGRNSRKMGFVALSSKMRQATAQKNSMLWCYSTEAIQSHILYQFIIWRRWRWAFKTILLVVRRTQNVTATFLFRIFFLNDGEISWKFVAFDMTLTMTMKSASNIPSMHSIFRCQFCVTNGNLFRRGNRSLAYSRNRSNYSKTNSPFFPFSTN